MDVMPLIEKLRDTVPYPAEVWEIYDGGDDRPRIGLRWNAMNFSRAEASRQEWLDANTETLRTMGARIDHIKSVEYGLCDCDVIIEIMLSGEPAPTEDVG